MSENENKALTNGENKDGGFFDKVKGWCKNAINWVKNIPWFSNVKPLIAWSVFGGTVGLAVILMLIFWL